MTDSEDYHTGRAAAYDTVVHLIARGWTVAQLSAFCGRRQMEAEEEADRHVSRRSGTPDPPGRTRARADRHGARTRSKRASPRSP